MATFTLCIEFTIPPADPSSEARTDAMFVAQAALDGIARFPDHEGKRQVTKAGLVRGTNVPHPWGPSLGHCDNEEEWIHGLGTLNMTPRTPSQLAEEDDRMRPPDAS